MGIHNHLAGLRGELNEKVMNLLKVQSMAIGAVYAVSPIRGSIFGSIEGNHDRDGSGGVFIDVFIREMMK